jgi:hypothetical protein
MRCLYRHYGEEKYHDEDEGLRINQWKQEEEEE